MRIGRAHVTRMQPVSVLGNQHRPMGALEILRQQGVTFRRVFSKLPMSTSQSWIERQEQFLSYMLAQATWVTQQRFGGRGRDRLGGFPMTQRTAGRICRQQMTHQGGAGSR